MGRDVGCVLAGGGNRGPHPRDPREGGRESAKSHISRCWAPNGIVIALVLGNLHRKSGKGRREGMSERAKGEYRKTRGGTLRLFSLRIMGSERRGGGIPDQRLAMAKRGKKLEAPGSIKSEEPEQCRTRVSWDGKKHPGIVRIQHSTFSVVGRGRGWG